MNKGIIGRKIGMTSIFENGMMIPVTVLEAGPCFVTQVKSKEKEGYNGIQLGFLSKKQKHTTKQLSGHFKKAKLKPLKILKEFKFKEKIDIEKVLKADLFSKGDFVDITSKSKGKGFQGTIKKYNFHRGPMSHGSRHHRRGGSLGSMAAAHVFKGHKMPGRMGGNKTTIQNLLVVDVILEKNIILVKGSIPGAKYTTVIIKFAKKNNLNKI